VKSLKTRLTLASVLAAILIIGVTGGLLYGLIQKDMQDQLDDSLVDRARTQAALVEFDEDGLQFEWEHSPEIVKSRALPRYFQVRDLEGKVLAHSKDLPDADFDYPRLKDDEDSEDGNVTLPGGEPGRAVVLRIKPKVDDEAEENPPTLLLIVAEPTEELDKSLDSLRNRFAFVALAGLFIGVCLIGLILQWELHPLEHLALKLRKLDASNLGSKVDIGRVPSELAPVIEQLNALLARVDDTLRREHEFTAGAAHELRTPLAGLRAKLELALSRERTPEQHREFAQAGMEITLQMQALVEDLLNLARADAAEAPVEVDLREALRGAWKPHAEQAEKRSLKVDWEFAAEKATVPPSALQLIAGNLFENAVNYTNDGGRIEIAAEATANGLRLEVANTGCTLRPDQREQVFEPFWRGDTVRTIGAHAGLGLAICRRVARKAGGDVTVQIIHDKFVATAQL
jgi:two-component system, OmpR family, heavy metal sensor histidine kinase CusS